MRHQELFDRPMQLIGDEAQRELMRLKIAVAGCGVLGLMLIIMLSRMGVSVLRVLDNDIVKMANLSNNIFLTKRHVGRGKAEVAAELARLRSLRRIAVKCFSFDVTDTNEWSHLNRSVTGMDLVFGCFDNLPARFSLNSAAVMQNVKYVDLGIEGFSGRIRLIDRSRACYACNPLVPEHLSVNIYSLTKKIGKGCDYAPTVTILPTAILTAAHAVMEGLKFVRILKGDDKYDYVYYDFLTSSKPVKMLISKQKDCNICGPNGLVSWS